MGKRNEVCVLAGVEEALGWPIYDVNCGEKRALGVKLAGWEQFPRFRTTPLQARTNPFMVLRLRAGRRAMSVGTLDRPREHCGWRMSQRIQTCVLRAWPEPLADHAQ